MTKKRSAGDADSRTSTTTVTHHGSSPRTDSPTSAMPISALSAIGSATLPKSVTRPRRAGEVAVDPVGERSRRRRRPAASDAVARLRARRRTSSSQPKTGTSSDPQDGQGVGDVPGAGLAAGSGHRVGRRRRPAPVAARSRPTSRGSATRSMPSRARPPRPARGHRHAAPAHAVGDRSRVTPSTSGPWCAARPTTSSVAVVVRRPPRPAPRRVSPMRSSARWRFSSSTRAVEPRDPLGDDVLGQLAVVGSRPRCRPRRSSRTRRRRRAAPRRGTPRARRGRPRSRRGSRR